jgi:phosphate:Na+ symporter
MRARKGATASASASPRAEPLIDILAPFVAGLGLFFCGVRLIAANLTPLVGRSLRTILGRTAQNPWLAALAGIAGGVATQGTTAVMLIVISFMISGMARMRGLMLVAAWSHVGAASLVIVTAVHTDLAVSYLLGLVGFGLYFDLDGGERRRHLFQALLGIGLLFLGIELMRQGNGPLQQELVKDGVIAAAARSAWLLALFGIALAIATQSSTVAGAIGVAGATAGLLAPEPTLVLLWGANLGAAMNYAFLARRGAVEARQVMLLQTTHKLAGTLALGVLILFDAESGTSLLMAGIRHLSGTLAGQLAWAFLLMQVFGSLTCTLGFPLLERLLARLVRAKPEEELGKPVFLAPEALVDPPLALDLADREEARLVARLPAMLDGVRADATDQAHSPSVLHQAGAALAEAITTYLKSVLDTQPDPSEVARTMRLQDLAQMLAGLHETVREFADSVLRARASGARIPTIDHMVEALHLLLDTLSDAVQSGDPTDRALALKLLEQRDELMDDIRRRLIATELAVETGAQEAVFRATMSFERSVWLARRSVLLARVAEAA